MASPSASDSTTLEDFIAFTKIAEAAKFDAVFLADGVAVRLDDYGAASRKAHNGTSRSSR